MIVLPEKALPLLTMQRPTYAGLSVEQASARFESEIDRFVKLNHAWLTRLQTKSDPHILDIGCGIGFGTAAVSAALKGKGQYVLLDKGSEPEPGKLFYGFEDDACAYNDLRVAVDFLESTGIEPSRLTAVDLLRDGQFPSEQTFDLVMSHIAWGFHFPISTYYDSVVAVTRPGSLLYVDIRAGTGGEQILEKDFELIETRPGRKSATTIWQRR